MDKCLTKYLVFKLLEAVRISSRQVRIYKQQLQKY